MAATMRVGGFSGGVDSQAMALWMRQHFPPEEIILLNTQARKNEHPLTVEFIEWYSQNIFPVTVVTPLVKDLVEMDQEEYGRKSPRPRNNFDESDELTFEKMAQIIGRFPASRSQFCTAYLKKGPIRRWLRENIPDGNFAMYVGVRRDESENRKCVKDCEWDDFYQCQLWRPIAAWSKKMVFAYLKEAGELINPLYTMGFNRVGCAPCINSGKDDIRAWAARFPEMIDKVREWEKSVGRTFFAPCVPGMEINFIDDVVTWSKTAHGGIQLTMAFEEADAKTGQCVSKYGLCE